MNIYVVKNCYDAGGDYDVDLITAFFDNAAAVAQADSLNAAVSLDNTGKRRINQDKSFFQVDCVPLGDEPTIDQVKAA